MTTDVSACSLEEFEDWMASQAKRKDNTRCGRCFHRHGGHHLRGCSIGSVRHNRFYKRQDPLCACSGYATAEQVADEEKQAAEDEAAYEAMPFECDECEERFESNEGLDHLFECNECGTKFTSANGGGPNGNRCEQCNKFAAKLSDYGCSSCEAGEVVERGKEEDETK